MQRWILLPLALALVPGALAEAQTVLTEHAQLSAADGDYGDLFGFSVAVDGDTALVGARNDDVGTKIDAGSAYVFRRNGTDWTLEAQLVSSNPTLGEFFGAAVALQGDLAVIGSWRADAPSAPDTGAVYVFERVGTSWTESARLVGASPQAHQALGWSVALDRGRIVAGAPISVEAGQVNAGSIHVFEKSGATWAETAKLLPNDGTITTYLGKSIALEGDTLVAGAPATDVGSHFEAGDVYVFEHGATGWGLNRRLLAFDGWDHDLFGSAVGISGTTIAVGAPGFENTPLADKGAVYLFERNARTWKQKGRIEAEHPELGSAFGSALALVGDLLAVGAPRDPRTGFGGGTADLFVRTTGVWTERARLLTAAPGFGDDFGTSLAISGGTVFVGVPSADRLPDLGVGRVDLFCAMPARVAARNAGSNPFSLQVSTPVVGQELIATVDLSTTGHDQAWLLAFAGQGLTRLRGGQVFLCADPDGSGELLGLPPQPGPLAVFRARVPNLSGLCGRAMTLQAVHVGGAPGFALSNAQDLVIGSF